MRLGIWFSLVVFGIALVSQVEATLGTGTPCASLPLSNPNNPSGLELMNQYTPKGTCVGASLVNKLASTGKNVPIQAGRTESAAKVAALVFDALNANRFPESLPEKIICMNGAVYPTIGIEGLNCLAVALQMKSNAIFENCDFDPNDFWLTETELRARFNQENPILLYVSGPDPKNPTVEAAHAMLIFKEANGRITAADPAAGSACTRVPVTFANGRIQYTYGNSKGVPRNANFQYALYSEVFAACPPVVSRLNSPSDYQYTSFIPLGPCTSNGCIADVCPLVYDLRVYKAGTGSGTVTSSPTGINCGSVCSKSYPSNTYVTLTATPASGSSFTGWSGACTGLSATCRVLMRSSDLVTANFTEQSSGSSLNVAKAGTGSGTVTSSPLGINCGTVCSKTYNPNTYVTLTATPASGSSFAGWSGVCTGLSATCSVTTSGVKWVTASFTAQSSTYNLSVTKSGTGSGTITSSPTGISCGTVCSKAYNPNTYVTLTAAPVSGSSFTGWGGACAGSSSTCSVTMNAAKSVTASFTAQSSTYNLSVTKSGTGSGTITSSPTGISCGTVCSKAYNPNTYVTLMAAPVSGSSFSGWGGACAGTSTTCNVIMNAVKSVTASFVQSPPGANCTAGCVNGVAMPFPCSLGCSIGCRTQALATCNLSNGLSYYMCSGQYCGN